MTRGITERELDSIRDAQAVFMPNLCEIWREGYAGDDMYEHERHDTDVPCRVMPGFGQWREVADRFQGVTFYTITMPWDQDVRAGDRVVDVYGRTFQVRDVKSASTYQTARQCLTEWLEDE